ncbi:MAG: sensor domain-containing diguanylate cyclase [Candidatus Omnitrophica bacterium]|nr:sensor domain-containing diguanylate cyclase [Candidatus Omnitrophota bacterium]
MPNFEGKPLSLKVTVYIVLFLLFYIILPIAIGKILIPQYFEFLSLFYLTNIIIIVFFLRRNSQIGYSFKSRIEELQESCNLLSVDYSKEGKDNAAIKEKKERYGSLKNILEEINQDLDLNSVADTLARESFSLIAGNRGVCVLYLVDEQTQRLALFKTRKEDKALVIKAKEGNIFDFWVLRHSNPLLIEDAKNDFRFDLEKLKPQDLRPISSLISTPFISENKFLGILRLDNQLANFYSQDDLRFLVSISDFGAVALENSQLFKRTQDLAIHDALTGLYTKDYFMERLKEECKRSLRQNALLSLMMLDVDFFKNYNDQFGHTAGDIVLRKISQIISDSLRNIHPIVSRFGGEEFCVVILGLDKKKISLAAESLRQAVEKEKIILRRTETHVTISIGVAIFPTITSDEKELIRSADKAMYAAKEKGRNRVCYI